MKNKKSNLADILAGTYKSQDGVVIEIQKTGGNSFSITSDHSQKKEEAGHNWIGTGFVHKDKYIGLFKYPDNDSVYQGFLGVQEVEFKDGTLVMKGKQYQETFEFGIALGPFIYERVKSV